MNVSLPDSKTLNEAKREQLFEMIKKHSKPSDPTADSTKSGSVRQKK